MKQLRFATIIVTMMLCAQSISAQGLFNWSNKYTDLNIGRPNVIKVNLQSLYYKTLSLSWERLQQQRKSYSLGLRWRLPSRLPMADRIEDAFSNLDPNIGAGGPISFFTRGRLGGWAFTADRRWYLGHPARTSAGKGVYISPFFRAETWGFKTSLGGTFNSDGRSYNINFRGRMSSVGAGLTIGYQFKLGENWTLDWGIVSGYYKYNMMGFKAKSYDFGFSNADITQVTDVINALKNDIIKFDASISNTEIAFNTAFPMPAVRPFLMLGYRFHDRTYYGWDRKASMRNW
jgi:hypothetical protein